MYTFPKAGDPVRAVGAARFFVETQLGGPGRIQESTVTVQTTNTTLVNNNPDRVAITFSNNSTFTMWIGTQQQIVQGNLGIPLPAQGGSVSLNVRDDFELVASQWIGVCGTSPSPIFIQEVISDVILAPETQ